jgi:DMSO reductase anchor subunit
MNPAFSVIFFTVLSGAGYGLWFLSGLDLMSHGLVCGRPSMPDASGVTLRLCGPGEMGFFAYYVLLSGFVLVTVGLLSSVGHLGKPQRAWRALSQWRTSWLSREGIVALLTFLPFVALCLPALYPHLSFAADDVVLRILGAVLAACSLATVYCTANIYACLKPIPAWHNRHVAPVYLLFALANGCLLTACIVHRQSPQMLLIVFVAGVAAAALAVMKLSYWRAIDRIELPSRESATALEGIGKVTVFERPHTEANYLTREMGFVLARKHSRKLRAIALLLFAGVPLLALALAWLLPVTSVFVFWIAALSALLGAFVERWLFFAEAKHMVMLYY